jgi:glyoxylase-like metal-dependent hydrolase (beta-lactamase superfamily II)
MHVQAFSFNPFQTNTYVAYDQGEAAVIDASPQSEAELRVLTGFIDANGLRVRHLLLTHAHIDHVFGCEALAERYAMGWRLHADDKPIYDHAEEQGRRYGIPLAPLPPLGGMLEEGDTVQVGASTLEVLLTPGHSPGSVTFADREHGVAFVGDVLFQGSIGRTDLWRGDLPTLMRSIFQQLVPLGDDTVVYPGHGAETTIAHEQATNPFLQQGGPERYG